MSLWMAIKPSLIVGLACLGLMAGGAALYVRSLPGFQGWEDAYEALVYDHGHGLYSDPAEAGRDHAEAEARRRQTEAARRAAWEQAVQPWHNAAPSQSEADRRDRALYAREMDQAPRLCREALRSQLPEGWTAGSVALGPSTDGQRYRTWLVTGWTQVTDAAGIQRRFDYRCDLVGTTVAGLMLIDSFGNEEILVPDMPR